MLGGVQVPWQVSSLAGQRLEFCRLAEQRQVEFTVLAARFGIVPKTGYKWLARYRSEGVSGLEDRSRIPLRSPSRTPVWLEEAVCELRSQYPAWGGRKIRQVLVRRGIDPQLGAGSFDRDWDLASSGSSRPAWSFGRGVSTVRGGGP